LLLQQILFGLALVPDCIFSIFSQFVSFEYSKSNLLLLAMTKPVTRSSTSGASSPMDPAPPSLQQLLDEMRAMKSELLTVLDTKTSTTAMELDSKISTVSEQLTNKILDLSHEIEVLSTDIDTKVSNLREQFDDSLVSFVDTAVDTARTEWNGTIHDVAQTFRSRVSENES